MTNFQIIVFVVGTGLLLLGGFSGYSLYKKAVQSEIEQKDETNTITLWGLFAGGISIGLLLIWLTLPS